MTIDYDDLYLEVESNSEGDPREMIRRAYRAGLEAATRDQVAQLIAHRACCGSEHDPANGKLHGYCVVCGVPWPCEYAGKPAIAALRSQMKMQEEVQTGFFKVAMDRAEKAEADNAALRQDAERYRWLRSLPSEQLANVMPTLWHWDRNKWDAIIDAALLAGKVRTEPTP